jgi:uncharacterized SAM-binding protein YcdF (DUF218 family)
MRPQGSAQMLQDILFLLSKILGPLSDPRVALFALSALGIALLWTPWRRTGRLAATLALGLAILLSAAPWGPMAVNWIENRFPPPVGLPDRVDGIVVLGGDVNSRMMRLRPISPGRDATRLIALADLARKFPDARLVFTGGSGQLLDREDTDADGARLLLPLLGLDPARVHFEDRSRNTYENAIFSHDLAKPADGETWLLVTSAFHMPRSVATFRHAGWNVVPYPVGYLTLPEAGTDWTAALSFDGRLYYLAIALREFVGFAYYYLTGRSDEILPGR